VVICGNLFFSPSGPIKCFPIIAISVWRGKREKYAQQQQGNEKLKVAAFVRRELVG
jgi:hypothetical protein